MDIDLEKLYKVTREEFGNNVDAILDKVKKQALFSYIVRVNRIYYYLIMTTI